MNVLEDLHSRPGVDLAAVGASFSIRNKEGGKLVETAANLLSE